MDRGSEPEHAYQPGDASASDAFPVRYVSPSGKFVRLKKVLPLDRLVEEFGYARGFGHFGRLRLSPQWWRDAHRSVGRRPPYRIVYRIDDTLVRILPMRRSERVSEIPG